MFISWALSRKRTFGPLDLAVDFDIGRVGTIDHDIGNVIARQKRLRRTIAKNVVTDVIEQLFLLGNRHHDILDTDDLYDDVADFLARGSRNRAVPAARGRSYRSAR
jgi:hypothetical protein